MGTVQTAITCDLTRDAINVSLLMNLNRQIVRTNVSPWEADAVLGEYRQMLSDRQANGKTFKKVTTGHICECILCM